MHRPEPTEPPSTKAAVAHLIDHLQDLDPDDAGPVMTDGQAEVVQRWARGMSANRGARAAKSRQRSPAPESDDDCRHIGTIGGPDKNYCFRCQKTVARGSKR